MACLVAPFPLLSDCRRYAQTGPFQEVPGKTQLTLAIKSCLGQSKLIAIDPQIHHLRALVKTRRVTKVVRNPRVDPP
ncbi:hypothetical protein D3C76_1075600 [compost metagenome]